MYSVCGNALDERIGYADSKCKRYARLKAYPIRQYRQIYPGGS
jgi:hypothetical protein